MKNKFFLVATAPIVLNLQAQLWSGPPPHSRPIGTPKQVKALLDIPNAPGSANRSVLKFVEGDLELYVTFLLIRPKTNAAAYAVTQTRLTHAAVDLVAECSNFDSLASPHDIGIGACSGTLDEQQVGVSYFR